MLSPAEPVAALMEEGAIRSVAAMLQRSGAEHIFLVVDDAAYQHSGAATLLEPVWRRFRLTRFSGFRPNPQLADVERGTALFRAERPDFVIAIGGGTAIDVGKLISFIGKQSDSAEAIIRGTRWGTVDSAPMMAIPTTAGTGSEATHFAVAYIGSDKYSVAHPSMRPAVAIIDPQLTYDLPAAITAATGLDALCQAIESIWAVGATDESITYAEDAAKDAFQNLLTSVVAPTPASRLAMCRASHLAGKAINISKTTAPHAVSYSLTSKYHVPHGFAVAMTIAKFLAFNADVQADDVVGPLDHQTVRERILRIVRLLGASTVTDACQRLDSLAIAVGRPRRFADLGIEHQETFRELADSANVQRMSNNPRRIDPPTLLRLLSEDRGGDAI